MGPSLNNDGYFRTAEHKNSNTSESRDVATGLLHDPTQQNTAAMAAIAAAYGEGESKEKSLLNVKVAEKITGITLEELEARPPAQLVFTRGVGSSRESNMEE